MSFGKPHGYLAVAGLVVAGILACGCRPHRTGGGPPAGPPEVAFVTVQPERVVLTTELPGRVSAYRVAEIRPQVNGIIQKRLFRQGARVKAGELLYQIDPAPYQAAYDRAKAALATAQADLARAEANLPALRARAERFGKLVTVHAIGEQDYDDARAALRQAEAAVQVARAAVQTNRAALESARINLSYTPIKSPISGRIGKSNITVGALVNAYQPTPLAVVQQLDPVYVDVTQATTEILRLQQRLKSMQLRRHGPAQAKVKLLLEDGTLYPLKGTLRFRDVTVDPTTATVTLRLVFPNPREVLLPGMYVRALVEEGTVENALLVPQQGVARDRRSNPIAWVVNKENKVEMRRLELDRVIGNRWLVTSGITAGDRVIVEGILNARPGIQVRAVPFGGQGEGSSGAHEHPSAPQTKAKGDSHAL